MSYLESFIPHSGFVFLVTSAATAAGASTASRRWTPSAHEPRATDGHAADRLAAVRMLRERGVLHALADLKALGGFAFKLGNGFVNVGGHGAE